MGLDVYVHSAKHKAASDEEGALWEAWEEGQETPKVDYPTDEPSGPSKLHPDNICTPTYLRSSYNNGGFNQAVPKFLKDPDTTLYDIFAPLIGDDEEGYSFEVTDPGKVLLVQNKARDVARRLRAITSPFTTVEVNRHGGMTEIEAIKWVEEALSKEQPEWMKGMAYSDRNGYVNPTGLTVYGATHSKGGNTILVVKAEDENGPWTKSYADSAEIIAEEFCQTLLDLIERDGVAYMAWSG